MLHKEQKHSSKYQEFFFVHYRQWMIFKVKSIQADMSLLRETEISPMIVILSAVELIKVQ